jgi:hypothetical protein
LQGFGSPVSIRVLLGRRGERFQPGGQEVSQAVDVGGGELVALVQDAELGASVGCHR